MNSYVEYKNTIGSLQRLLGLTCINTWSTEELHPYTYEVLRYLNEQLVLQDPSDIYTAIRSLCDLIDSGNEILLEGGDIEDLYYQMDLSDRDQDIWSDTLFGIAWGNTCTSLWESCKCNYASILWDLEHQECECQCGCTSEIDETDNLYGKLVGNGAAFTGTHGCGCSG